MRYDSFPLAVIERLDYYVYLLIDPETNKVFYVGKGIGDRIFAHLNAAISEDTENAKLDHIRAIRACGLEVRHVIHRHGLTEKEAFEVEAALIDLLGLPELTNVVSGHHSHEHGPMSIAEVIETYSAPHLSILEPAIIVIVNRYYRRGMSADELYEVARGNWVIGQRREKARYVLAVSNSIVREVYEVERWYPSAARTVETKNQGRWRFDGHIAENLQHYVGGSVEQYVTVGAQNPIKYVNC